ncbi:MAG: glycosyltransferase family 2 protein [Lachnoclostridium sp.]|nr:glycosyltransferase family 2 protein [Lachnoclostridium sp.]
MSNVHIVLATYNAEKYLREQLNSILKSTYQSISIEICDDASTDKTIQIAEEYMSKYPGKIFLHENKVNKGCQLNFLEGIKRSKSPYIMLCDQDDVWFEDKIENTLLAMRNIENQKRGKPVLVFSDALVYDEKYKTSSGRFHKKGHYNIEKCDLNHLLMENKVIGCTVMVSQNILPYLNSLPKEIRVHDWWLALICSVFGVIEYVDKETLLYRQHCDNIIGSMSFVNYVKHRIAKLKEQKTALLLTYKQAEAFYFLFEKQMSEYQKNIVKQFIGIPTMGFFKKRTNCLRNGYLKSGLIRNIALMLIL